MGKESERATSNLATQGRRHWRKKRTYPCLLYHLRAAQGPGMLRNARRWMGEKNATGAAGGTERRQRRAGAGPGPGTRAQVLTAGCFFAWVRITPSTMAVVAGWCRVVESGGAGCGRRSPPLRAPQRCLLLHPPSPNVTEAPAAAGVGAAARM